MTNNRRVLIVGADGLRPDQITPELMPAVSAFADRGVRFMDHHSVYPTHTRVVGTSFVTGNTPGKHGVVANTMIVPFATPDHIIDTGDYQSLDALEAHDPGGTQLTETLSEIVVRNGGRVAVAGTGSSGSNVLWTYKDRGRIVNTGSTYGIADLYDLRDKLGPVPDAAIPNSARLHWTTSAVTNIFLRDPEARVITLWFAEPDSSLHYTGIGSPETSQSLREIDACFAEILATMDQLGIRDQFDIFLLSDHGHSTVRAHRTLRDYLADARSELPGLPPLTTASDYIYAVPGSAEPSAAELAPLAEWLQAQPWADVVLAGLPEAESLPGVIPLRSLWNDATNHRRPLLGVSPVWTHDANEFGAPGSVASLTTQSALKSSHGSLSPYDLHCTFIAGGPSFSEGMVSTVPTGVTDILPTILHLLDLPAAEGIDGRVVREALAADGETPFAENYELPAANGRSVAMHRVGSTTYVHGSTVGGAFPLAEHPVSTQASPSL